MNFTSYLYFPLTTFECLVIPLVLFIVMMFSIYVEFINSNVITRFIVEVLDSLIWFGLMFLLLSILLVILHLFIVTPIILRRILII